METTVGRWVASSPVAVPGAELRVAARALDDGRVEFGLQQRLAGAWGDRLLPVRRFFPASGPAGRWLASSPIPLGEGSGRTTSDPLGLVSAFEFTTAYSLGEDVWDVWLCDTPSGGKFSTDRDARLNPYNYADTFAQRVSPWFDWQSDGAYQLTFRPGGVVQARGAEPETCWDAVLDAASRSDSDGLLIVSARDELDEGGALGYGGCGFYSRRSWRESGRAIVVFAEAYRAPAVLAHELGHSLCWPHSFTGSALDEDGLIWEYDNPMDQLSGVDSDAPSESGEISALTVGTIAFNRYAAGWIDPDDVEIHEPGQTRTYRLAPPGVSGTQLLVLADAETGTEGRFVALGARKRGAGGAAWHDSGLTDEGIELYWIDQTAQGCELPDRGACYGLDRRTVPVDSPPDSTWHVVNEGGSFWVISGYEVSVGEYSSTTGTYPVTVRPADLLGWNYNRVSDEASWSGAFLHSEDHNLTSTYGLATLEVVCVDGEVDVLVGIWSDYIDWDFAWSDSWFGVATVSYRFGDFGRQSSASWTLDESGSIAFMPATSVNEFLDDLHATTQTLHVSIWTASGAEVGTIAFAAAEGRENIDRVVRDCGGGNGRVVPVSDWVYGTFEASALYGPLPEAYLTSFDHSFGDFEAVAPVALFLRCIEVNGRLRVLLSLYSAGQTIYGDRNEDVQAAYRFDSEPIVRREWWAPTAGQEFVFPALSDQRRILSDLQRHERLTVQLSDAQGNEIGAVTFRSVSGADRAVAYVEEGCRT
ncbi:MAG: hypothetical protein OXH20_14110 [bacterium]|nr:hypothetical protein [bacterium]